MHWTYLLATWSFLVLITWSIWRMAQDIVQTTKRMHRIPCAHCQFFANSYYLKCPVHPKTALTEAAIHCPDYRPWLENSIDY